MLPEFEPTAALSPRGAQSHGFGRERWVVLGTPRVPLFFVFSRPGLRVWHHVAGVSARRAYEGTSASR